MKRLGIFSFYEKNGVVDSYIEYLLSELMTVLDRLIIVVNGQVSEDGKLIFSRYTNELIIRENKGFDGGAYADVVVNFLGGDIRNWDELVLCNDTFFGPFVPMKSIFEKMEREPVDFWGLNEVEWKMLSHIQSYFLVFGARILQNEELTHYFRVHIDPMTKRADENGMMFELGLFLYLTEKQYSYRTYCYTELCSIYESPDVCLERYGLPLLKKKAFSEEFNSQAAINAIRYVRQSTNYDTDHILRCAQRLYGLCINQEVMSEYISPSLDEAVHMDNSNAWSFSTWRFSEDELDTHIGGRDFYIYGTGVFGRFLYLHLYKNKGLKGFVISDSEQIEKPFVYRLPVLHYGETDKNTLVILGVGKELTEAIKPKLDKRTEYIELWE